MNEQRGSSLVAREQQTMHAVHDRVVDDERDIVVRFVTARGRREKGGGGRGEVDIVVHTVDEEGRQLWWTTERRQGD